MNEKIGKIIELFKELMEQRFYGTLVFRFEAGKIVHATKEQSIKF